MSWWEDMNRCRGKTKAGKRRKKFCLSPYERRKGDLRIPLTCEQHKDQEEQMYREYCK